MEHLNASRVLMGDSLAFHIIFVMFGLTLPVLVVWFEWWGLHKEDKKSVETAYFWAKIMALLVITGVISGTVIALQMSLVWPGILKFGGQVIGLPFMFETYAFLLEAVFLALYIATWKNPKIPQALHVFFGVMIIIGSLLSAFAITSVNAWMNLPTGFQIVQGKFQNIDVWQAMFSQTSLVEFFHSIPAYYLSSSLIIASIYGIKILKSKYKTRLGSIHKFDWVIVKRLMIFSAICMVAIVITADLTGKYLAKNEPAKLATIEVVNTTGSNQPFIFGGVPNENGELKGPYIKIPNALSILAGNSTKTVVKGLEEVPKNQRPPSYIHVLFNIKLVLVGILATVIGLFLAIKLWRPNLLAKTYTLVPLIIVGFFGLIIVELGWMLTEIGRQPWAVHGYVTTAQAVTKTNDISSFGYIFPLAYLLLFIVTILAILKIVKSNKEQAKVKK